ncbi:MAG: efflux RND transporter periplasmic adaptor subunit [Acidobacteria bacterium]|nr:efflux RND transporter periplasmic adaptor subunit [Acidobacteriota bacterium]
MSASAKAMLWAALGLAVGVGATFWAMRPAPQGAATAEPAASKRLYTCAMHPHIVRDHPGDCPVCGMRLTPVEHPDAAAQEEPAAGERKVLYWRAPMDPNYVSDKPGKSPMGMDLVPVYEDEAGGAQGANIVRVDPSFLQNFAVRTAVAERGSIPIEIRTVGVLAHDEESVHAVTTRYEGWIEQSYHNTIGEHIHEGTPLFEVYSPALLTTEQEFLAARDYVARLEKSGAYPEAVERAKSLFASAQERLHYWDLTEEQIEKIAREGAPERTVTIFAPASGHLMWKSAPALDGMRVTPGMTILTIANHTKLWTEVAVYERDMQYVRQGMPVQVSVEAFPGRTWRGRVNLFGPALDPKSRTLTAFVEIPNQDLKLRPGMYADVLLRPPAAGGAVKVPEEAVIHSGERSLVIVQAGRGAFEPREVEIGPSGGGFQEIRSGVEAGETVVTSSQFLIDSESNLKAAIRQLLGNRGAAEEPAPPEAMPGMKMPAPPPAQAPAPQGHAGHSH